LRARRNPPPRQNWLMETRKHLMPVCERVEAQPTISGRAGW